jgi:hypothetical protein
MNITIAKHWISVHDGSEREFVSGTYLIFKTKNGNYHKKLNFENSSK